MSQQLPLTKSGLSILLVAALVLVGTGALSIRSSSKLRDREEASESWPTTEGRLNWSRVTQRMKGSGETKRQERFSVQLEYSFRVGDVLYRARQIYVGRSAPEFRTRPAARAPT